MKMETLPDEIFEIICEKLAKRDLLNMMLVDRYSRSIIENSPILMEALPLYMTDDENDEFEGSEKFIEPLMDSRRKVANVVVELKREKIMKFLGIFKKFGESIKILEIKTYRFDTIDQLRIILRYLTNLHTLKVANVTFNKSEHKILNSIVQIPKMSLRNLRHIECVNSDPKIFSLFTNNYDIQLRKIRLRANDELSFNYFDFVEFMTHQSRLKYLTLDGLTSGNCNVLSTNGFISCQLERLSVENCNFPVKEQMKNLIQVIKSQKALNCLKILATPIPATLDVSSTYRQIFSNSTKTAQLDLGDLLFFHSSQFTNQTITSLTLHGNFAFENLPIFINFITMFPNVTQLKLVSDSPIGDKYLFHILSSFKNLAELQVPGFTSRTADSNFANLSGVQTKLQTLVLDYIDYDVKYYGWKNISSNLKTVDKLVIKRDFGKVSNEIVDIIVKKLRLRHLELGIGVVSGEILKKILFNDCCEQLRVLKIAKQDFEKIDDKIDFGKNFARSHLQLSLCDNEYFHVIKD